MFEQNIINIHGEKGKIWLNKLPNIIAELADLWSLTDLKPVENLSYNYVLSGMQADQPIILKINPTANDLNKEAKILQAFGNFGAVKLLAQAENAIMLKRAVPGITLKSYFYARDEEAIQIACSIMNKLHHAHFLNQAEFPHIDIWLAAIDQDLDIPIRILHKARKLKANLLNSAQQLVLLHGDLHHDNILLDDDWIAIDPKGVIGEKAYEVAAFIRNPIPELLDLPDAKKIISIRIKLFAEVLNLDQQRIIDWCFVQAVLAWIWALEDGLDPNYFIRLSEIFESFLQLLV